MVVMGEFAGGREIASSLADPVSRELNRLEDQLKGKEGELAVANSEIKALKVAENLKYKALLELSNKLEKLEEKLTATENLLEQKNLEIKKLTDEKKEALVAQFAAEATLRRVHASQRDEDSIPMDAIIAPLESDIKTYRNEIAMLQEDNKALERLVKSKEMTLVEAEKILKSALERALIVENVLNENFELRRQIEIVKDENKVLDKSNRQKVIEIEKLSQIILELEESILACGSMANVVSDYQRQVSELNEEKRVLERELARANVSVNRVATVVANEWKDDNDKIMPVKQWLEERRFMQGEMQRLRVKLSVSERSTKAETLLKDKLKLRLKTLEEGLKHGSCLWSKKAESSDNGFGFQVNNGGAKKRPTSQPRASLSANKLFTLQQPNSALQGTNAIRNPIKKGLWTPRSKLTEPVGKENTEKKVNSGDVSGDIRTNRDDNLDARSKIDVESGEDLVSGFLYDRLQKEVIMLRKSQEAKEEILNIKNNEMKMLQKKVSVLTKALEVESKKMRREAATADREKEVSIPNTGEAKQKSRSNSNSKRATQNLDL